MKTGRNIRRAILWLFAAIGAAALVFVLVAFLAMQLAGWSKREWPPIARGGTLVSACNTLLASHPSGDTVDPSAWPEPIQALAPRHVSVRGDAVYILISGGGIGAGWGYLVTPKANAVPGIFLRANRAWGAGHENVFKFVVLE